MLWRVGNMNVYPLMVCSGWLFAAVEVVLTCWCNVLQMLLLLLLLMRWLPSTPLLRRWLVTTVSCFVGLALVVVTVHAVARCRVAR